MNDYFLMSSGMKDSFLWKGKLITSLVPNAYEVPFKQFINYLSGKTTYGILPYKMIITSSSSGDYSELRSIIRIPSDWTGSRFTEVALNEWRKNPSVDILLAAYVATASDFDDEFLARGM